MAWKDALKHGQNVVFVTSSKDARPHANVVMSLGFIDNKLLVADCQMTRTPKNIRRNPRVCVVTAGKRGYYRIKGHAAMYTSGKYFDAAVKRTGPNYTVKHAITIGVKEVFDLGKIKRIL
jgi:general stress protein 26